MTLLSNFKNSFRGRGDGGFTLIGIMLIIAAMALVTAAFFVTIQPSTSTRDAQLTIARMDLLRQALIAYKLHHAGQPPGQLSDLVAAVGAPCTIDTGSSSSTYRQLKGWCGPYLDQPLVSAPNAYQTDGWGVLFHFDGVNLISYGPDRTFGTGDDIKINNF